MLLIAVITLGVMFGFGYVGYKQDVAACYDDCTKLGFQYLKYSSGGFGSDECWCWDNSTRKAMQIW